MEEMIRAEHLSYEYVRTWEEESGSRQERIQALDDLSLSIEKGSFVAVLGQWFGKEHLCQRDQCPFKTHWRCAVCARHGYGAG